jgi:hypothetical protein
VETPSTYALAGLGAVQGAWKYYRPSPSALAWGAIVAYEIFAPEGQLLSEGADRAIERYPRTVPLVIGVVSLHLANAIPERYDPLHAGLKFLKQLR